jgi:hypothetical protein
MPIHCAWCGVQLGDDARLAGESHGICPNCEKLNFPPPSDLARGAARGPEQSGHDGNP